MSTADVIVVGAGLAGLSCARRLNEAGIEYLVLDAADAVGGRVRTDEQEGFLLDRGFQVFLEAYPEARRVLDYEALALASFTPGALSHRNGRFRRLADPFRKPWMAMTSLFSSIGTIGDKLRMLKLRQRARRGSLEDLFDRPEVRASEHLAALGFSEEMTEGFLRPFLGGVFLDRELETSSRMLEFVFRMFSSGKTSLPANGMRAIPEQIAAGLDSERIRLGARIERLHGTRMHLASGEALEGRALVLAVEGPAAARLLAELLPQPSRGVQCLYFAAEKDPVGEPTLVLDGDGAGPVNNLCVPSTVSASYAPAGAVLVSATVLDAKGHAGKALERAVREQLAQWYGPQVRDWRHLRTYDIPHALPAHVSLERPAARHGTGVYVSGDFRETASINGAMVSGRKAAEAVLADLHAEKAM